jgi:hypothetical protein
MVKFIFNLLKINMGGNKFLPGLAQFAVVEKATGVSLDACENSFDIEQVLYSDLSLATYVVVGGIGANAVAGSDDDGDEYAQQ